MQQSHYARRTFRFTPVPFFLENLNEMRKNGIGVDCTLVAQSPTDGSLIRKDLHSIILLANKSNYFEEMFLVHTDLPKVQDKIAYTVSQPVSEGALEKFLELLYTGRFDAFSPTSYEVIWLCHIFKLPSNVLTELLCQVYNELKTEKGCQRMSQLARALGQDDLVAKTMGSWINIHAGLIYFSTSRRSRKNMRNLEWKPEWVLLWNSAVDLMKNSYMFRSVWDIVDVVKWIIDLGYHIEFYEMLDTILPNSFVQKSKAALKYVANFICLRAERRPGNITLKNYLQVRNLRGQYFAHNEFQQLQATLCKFMAKHFEKVVESSALQDIDAQELIIILKLPDLNPPSKPKAFDALAKWINKIATLELLPEVFTLVIDMLFRSESSQTQYSCFLQKIDMDAFSSEFLIDTVLKNQLTQNDQKAKEFLARIICSKLDGNNSELTVEKCFTIRRLMKIYQFTEYTNLKKNICQVIINNLQTFCERDEFNELECDEMTVIFGSPDVTSTFEQEKFGLILKWVNYEVGREQWLPDLFNTIKISCLSNMAIKTMTSDPLVINNPALLHHVIQGLCLCRDDNTTLQEFLLAEQTNDDDMNESQNGSTHTLHDVSSPDGIHDDISVGALDQLPLDPCRLSENRRDCESESNASDAPSHQSGSYSFSTASYPSGRSSPDGSDIVAGLDGPHESSGYDTHLSAAPLT